MLLELKHESIKCKVYIQSDLHLQFDIQFVLFSLPLHVVCRHFDVGGGAAAVAGHVGQPREVRVDIRQPRRLARLQQSNFLQSFLQFDWSLQIKYIHKYMHFIYLSHPK